MRIDDGVMGFMLSAAALLVCACDESPGEDGNMGGMGGEGQQSRGGRNAGGTMSTPRMQDDSTVPPPQTMQCGETLCRDALVGDISLPPCCADTEREACGLDLTPLDYLPVEDGCTELRQSGARDPDCPSLSFDDPVAQMDLPGCCMPSGQCGVVADLVLVGNFGCVDPREFLTQEMNVPNQQQPCVPVVTDAGTPDIPDASTGPDPDASTPDPMNLNDAG